MTKIDILEYKDKAIEYYVKIVNVLKKDTVGKGADGITVHWLKIRYKEELLKEYYMVDRLQLFDLGYIDPGIYRYYEFNKAMRKLFKDIELMLDETAPHKYINNKFSKAYSFYYESVSKDIPNNSYEAKLVWLMLYILMLAYTAITNEEGCPDDVIVFTDYLLNKYPELRAI